jgi:hypothetical protein
MQCISGPTKITVDLVAAGDGVFDFVVNEGAAVAFLEGVLVMPAAIRSADLVVREEVRWIPAGDFAFPVDRDAVDLDSILNARSDGHDDGLRSGDLEVEKRWGEHFKVFRGSEEREDFGKRTREPEFGSVGKCLHGGISLGAMFPRRLLEHLTWTRNTKGDF